MKISELVSLENNPRSITKGNLEKLKRDITDDVGFLEKRKILVNKKDGKNIVYAGNMRLLAVSELGWNEIPDKYIDIEENLSDELMKKRALRDNQEYGEWDFNLLSTVFRDELEKLDLPELDFNKIIGELGDNPYTTKLVSPIYEPSEEVAEISELLDREKTEALLKEINSSNIPDSEKDFLRLAATRHIVFDYAKIANYYARASKETQELMEKSALVIIDFEKAVENGFIRLSEFINEIRYDEK